MTPEGWTGLESLVLAIFAGLVMLAPVLAHLWIRIHRETHDCDDDEGGGPSA